MVIISSAELRNNMKKYLDIAKNEKVVIQRGRNETFVLVAQNNAADEDLSRAISVDEVLARVREGLNEMFERKEGQPVYLVRYLGNNHVIAHNLIEDTE